MSERLLVGDLLYGYCRGYFGDSWNDKRVEAVGADWVVARDDKGVVWFAEGTEIHDFLAPNKNIVYGTLEDMADDTLEELKESR